MAWHLRYASHLGFRALDLPLYRDSVGSLDPVAHIEFAAGLGFAGVQDALARRRTPEEQKRVGDTRAKLGLEAGCTLFAPIETVLKPLWGSADPEALATLTDELKEGVETAKRGGTRLLAVIGGRDPRVPLDRQLVLMIDKLRRLAPLAERAGITLCLESTNTKTLPNMLMEHIGDAHTVVKAVGHPNVKLIFDTGHVQAMDGDILGNLDATYDDVAVVQIADNPGRVEPGAGELNFATILGALKKRNYTGLVELEHHWAQPGRDSEQRGIDYLKTLDARLA
jgi:hydroxypyruvate isomerase